MKALSIVLVLSLAVCLSGAAPIHKVRAAVRAKAQSSSFLDTSAEAYADSYISSLRAKMTEVQWSKHVTMLQAEKAAIERTIARLGAGGSKTSALLLAKTKRPGIQIANNMAKFMGAFVASSTAMWYVHSGTAAYLYGFRDKSSSTEDSVISDVDCHVHPMSSGHEDKAAGTACGKAGSLTVHVDAYDPCVDRGQQWARDVETAVRSTNPYSYVSYDDVNVITLNQLLHEYTFIVRRVVKPGDAVTRLAATNAGAVLVAAAAAALTATD